MKKITTIFVYILFLISFNGFAQEEEILGNRCRDTKFDIVNFYDLKDKDTIFFRKINESIPTIKVYVKIKAGDSYFPVQSIIFRDSATNRVIRTIDSEIDSIAILNIEFDDYNFDGFTDIYVYDGCAILANCFGKVYLYNTDLKNFERHYGFDEMTSVQADGEKKEIYSFNQCCAGAESETRTYKYFEGKLTLVKKISKSYSNEKSKFKYVIEEYDKDGKLLKKKEIISDKFELDE